MAKKILIDLDFVSSAKITNLPAAVSGGDAVRKTEHDSDIANLQGQIEGLSWKDSVRVGLPSNVSLATPGATLDGITMASNDRVLLRGQTAGAENGIYKWNGALSAMTRAVDASTAAELEQAIVVVEEGTDAGTSWRQTAVNLTLETTTITFVSFGADTPAASETVAGKIEIATQGETDAGTDDVRAVTPLKFKTSPLRAKGFSGDVGNGSLTQIDVVHNLATRDVMVQVRENASPYSYVVCDSQALDTNTTRLIFGVAPTSAQYRCLVQKIVL